MTHTNRDTVTVGHLMTGDLIALRPIDTVARARRVILRTGLHALPIIDVDRTLGVVTLADCQEKADDEPLANVVGKVPLTIDIGATPAEAAAMMRSEHVHHLLVTEGGSAETVGILSSFDLLTLVED